MLSDLNALKSGQISTCVINYVIIASWDCTNYKLETCCRDESLAHLDLKKKNKKREDSLKSQHRFFSR